MQVGGHGLNREENFIAEPRTQSALSKLDVAGPRSTSLFALVGSFDVSREKGNDDNSFNEMANACKQERYIVALCFGLKRKCCREKSVSS